jgi:hypothetical protein
MTLKRIYHPTLDSFQDVPEGSVDEWAEAGWRKTAPKHVTTDGLPEVGSFPGLVDVPRDPDTGSTSAGTGGTSGSARASSGTRTASAPRTGRTAGTAGSTSTSGGSSAGSTT